MDRTHLQTQLTAAQQHLNRVQQAQELLRSLELPVRVHIHRKIGFGEPDQSRIVLLRDADLDWSSNFYTRVALEGTGAEEQLRRYITASSVLPGLMEAARAGTGGFLRRLFNPESIRRGETALEDLTPRVADLDRQVPGITPLLDAATTATSTQRGGVHLFPGAHPVGQRYIDAARAEIARQLGEYAPGFRQWDGHHLTSVHRLVHTYASDPNSQVRLRAEAERALSQINRQRVEILLEQLPVDALRTATNHRLRFGSLDTIGVSTVAEVLRASESLLATAQGIGHQTARHMKAAAQTLQQEALGRNTVLIGDTPTQAAVALIRILARFEQADALSPAERERRNRVIDYIQQLPAISATDTTGWIVVGAGPDQGDTAWNRITDDLAWVSANPNLFHPQHITPPPADIWDDYLTRPAHYQGLLATLLGREIEGVDEHLDTTVLQRIRELELDTTHLRNLHLRGYQSFGARFTVVQKKVLLGDDMGLGKTIQAISVAAHLTATEDNFRTLVVVPASVIVNWVRECRRFTDLPIFVAHGQDKEAAVTAWADTNGILICTYAGARSLDIPAPGLIIADEAHMIKNPTSKRSQACARLITAADYALLMTGTPLENKVSEFVALIRYIQPELITRGMSTMSAGDFRARIAPAYLRRNQADVLDELPERTDSIDWIELTPADRVAYDDQVRAGNWMGMRRSAMLAPKTSAISAKMKRIIELLDEAEEHGRKTLIFTFFLDILDELEHVLGERVTGRIDGSVPATRRQELVDALTDAPAGSALISQITAGGVGLNIQSASQVIICEPQVKPTIEQQAVARVHRMGQTATVNVHRLIGDDTADERMLEILAGKTQIFDVYARLSETAETPDAVDITEAQLAASIIDAERARLGLEGEG
ncbi:DEAD/DEAH box helicase [Corynebacterium gallinarum]|uniref:DEAD/DEAH box helicase n=1 Tax=Corynebacterium gallinarum TaxID=2762214 RepID=A0A8I0LCE4_9CORY|nr:DEAD/DEAH box helicase [Corynebacterium gallinarum]MBD8030316.1 DEAD/DEAH box helicase [Corynebacterium gallinarum]